MAWRKDLIYVKEFETAALAKNHIDGSVLSGARFRDQ